MELDKKRPIFKFKRIGYAFQTLGINIFKGRARNELHRLNNLRRPTFWERDDLQFILVDAKKAYLKAAKQNHPDKQGNHEQMIQINQAWKFIEVSFKRKGFTLN